MEFKTYIEDKDLDDVIQELPECIVDKKVLRLLFKHQVKQRSDEWYVTRKSCLTASDAATALGQNPYKKPAELIKSKSGFYANAQPDPQMIRATEHGIKYEDEAAAAYAVLRPDLAPFFEAKSTSNGSPKPTKIEANIALIRHLNLNHFWNLFCSKLDQAPTAKC